MKYRSGDSLFTDKVRPGHSSDFNQDALKEIME